MKDRFLCSSCITTSCHLCAGPARIVLCPNYKEKAALCPSCTCLCGGRHLAEKTYECPAYIKIPAMKEYDISEETSRTYTYHFPVLNAREIFRHKLVIQHPEKLFIAGEGHAFHRVFNGDVVWLCHAPGPIRDVDRKIVGFCFVECVPKDKNKPCAF